MFYRCWLPRQFKALPYFCHFRLPGKTTAKLCVVLNSDTVWALSWDPVYEWESSSQMMKKYFADIETLRPIAIWRYHPSNQENLIMEIEQWWDNFISKTGLFEWIKRVHYSKMAPEPAKCYKCLQSLCCDLFRSLCWWVCKVMMHWFTRGNLLLKQQLVISMA